MNEKILDPLIYVIILLILSCNIVPYLQLKKTRFFLLFNNNHKPTTNNIFGLLSHKNQNYGAALKIKLSDKIGPKITQTNYYLYWPLFSKI